MATSPRISLEDLIALNDEMVALVRAGVPLDQGLRSMSRDVPGRLGRFTTLLSERLEKGQSLDHAIDELRDSLPPIYCAVVAAGLRSGRLAAALEGVSTTVRRVAEMRRTVIAAMVYPFIVLVVATGLALFTATKTAPVVARTYEVLELAQPGWYQTLMAMSRGLPDFLPWFWAVLAAAILFWLYRSSRATSASQGGMSGFPSISRVLHAGRMATFADVLALMIEQDVPMDEALILSSSASGDAGLARSGRALGERMRRGEGTPDLGGIPPLLGWLLLRGGSKDYLVKALRRTSDAYRRKANHLGNWLSIYLPIFLTAVIGGSVALFYVLLVLAPFYNLLYQLS